MTWMLWFVLLPLPAADLETQHAFEAGFTPHPRFHLTLHSRLRTQQQDLGFYQVRAGPVAEFVVTPRFSLVGGYYFARQEGSPGRWREVHRPFAGVEATLLQRYGTWDVRSLMERFASTGPDFTRWRNRVLWLADRKHDPYAATEVFVDAQGFRSLRLSGGVRWRLTPAIVMDTGYFYEFRRAALDRDRQMFLTTLQIRPGKLLTGRDPDR